MKLLGLLHLKAILGQDPLGEFEAHCFEGVYNLAELELADQLQRARQRLDVADAGADDEADQLDPARRARGRLAGSIGPGAIALTVMPRLASSWATALVMPMTPAFADA